MKRLDPAYVQQQISDLLLAWPELAEDEVLRADIIETGANLLQLIAKMHRKAN